MIIDHYKQIIKEEIRLFKEAQEVIEDKGDFEFIYKAGTQHAWLVPKKSQTNSSTIRNMRIFLTKIKRDYGIKNVEPLELNSMSIMTVHPILKEAK